MKGDGSFFFGAKEKILAGLQVGGEPMMEFGTDGLVRSTYFDLSKSHLFSQDSYYIDIIGGDVQQLIQSAGVADRGRRRHAGDGDGTCIRRPAERHAADQQPARRSRAPGS